MYRRRSVTSTFRRIHNGGEPKHHRSKSNLRTCAVINVIGHKILKYPLNTRPRLCVAARWCALIPEVAHVISSISCTHLTDKFREIPPLSPVFFMWLTRALQNALKLLLKIKLRLFFAEQSHFFFDREDENFEIVMERWKWFRWQNRSFRLTIKWKKINFALEGMQWLFLQFNLQSQLLLSATAWRRV